MLRRLSVFGITFFILAAASVSVAWAADVTPPTTTLLNLSGTMGNNSWYRSTVNVSLRATDLESGPATTTYQIDSKTPVNLPVNGGSNSVLNPSFENGSTYDITNWDGVAGGFALLYQTSTPSKFGYGSAAILALNLGQYSYWTNVNDPASVSAGQTYNASVWVKTVSLGGPGAWMEVWAQDSTNTLSDVKLATSNKVTGDFDWQLLSNDFTVPSGYNEVYLKLGHQAAIGGLSYFDGASINAGGGGTTQFSIVDNGIHTLKYHSTDGAGNVEADQTRSNIKIDTVAPQDWNNFTYAQSGNNHTFVMQVDVRDLTSGVNVATAQFRAYDRNNCDCWGSWTNVSSVKRKDNGANASSGYTGYVTLITPAYDYGNSGNSTTPEVQFRIDDMAGGTGTSPIYALFGPWLQLTGMADIYSGGDISISGATPSGQNTLQGIVASGTYTISNVVNPNNWFVKPYSVPQGPITGIETYLPSFSSVQGKAGSLPSGRLPSTSGIYSFTGKYTIDSNTLSAAFQSAIYNAVIIVNGDLAINNDYQLNSQTALVFLVTGQVVYKADVAKSAGVIIAEGSINTGSDDTQLVHSGSLIGLGGLSLGRDLGKNGNPNNGNTPAEKVVFQPQYFNNQGIAGLLSGGGSTDIKWQESD